MNRVNRPLRVLAFIPNLSGGGAERAVINLQAAVDPELIDLHIVAHERKGSLLDTMDPKASISFLHEGDYSRWHLPILLYGTLRKSLGADVLIGANEGRATFFALLAGLILRKPVVSWIHNNWSNFASVVSWKQSVSLKLSSRISSALVTCSKGVTDDLIANFGVPESKTETIYHGFRVDNIKTLSQEEIPESEREIFSKPVVINVGRLDIQKGQEFLIEAHSRLIKKGLAHNLVLLGQGDRKAYLVSVAERYGVRDSVFFLGFRNNPYLYMRAATVFALTSRFEGFGLVLVEALICECAILSTDCESGPSEILGNGEYGLLVEKESVEEIAQGLEILLRSDEKRQEFSEKALDRASHFKEESSVTQWQTLLQKQLKN